MFEGVGVVCVGRELGAHTGYVMLRFFVCRPAIVVLLMSMVNEKQPFVLRCAVLYCFQCFLFKNEIGQSQLVQTLLPSSTEGMTHFGSGDAC